jgi:transposase InsO family protein
MRTLKEEHVEYTEYADFVDAEQHRKHWLDVAYTQQRIYSALADATPMEFEAAFWAQTTPSPSSG